MTASKFEDLEVWKVARELANDTYELCRTEQIKNDYGFSDQLRRASVSVMNNIAEGFERGSNKDFAKFLFIARGSSGEVRSMLYLALDQSMINKDQFKRIHNLCVKSSKMCWGLIKHLQKTSNWKTGLKITILMLVSGTLFNRL